MQTRHYIAAMLIVAFNMAYGQQSKQEQDTIRQENLSAVVISATRLPMPLKYNPGAVTLVTPRVLSYMPRSIAADEALRLTPGVRIDNQANGSRLHMSIRGQGILSERGLRGIRVILDDIPINDPSGFAPDLYDVDWETVQHIEVLRGPSASLYGCSSNAGVIDIVTDNGGEKPVNGTIYSSFGSNGFYKVLGQIDGSKDDMNYRVTFSRLQGNGYRHHTAFWGNNFCEKINWHPGEKVKITQVLYVTDYFNQNAEGLNLSQLNDPRQANPDAIPFNEYQKTRRMTNGATGEIKIAKNQELQLSGFLRLAAYTEPGSSAVQDRKLRTSGASAQYTITNGKKKIINHLSIGSDYEYQIISEYKVPNIKNPTRTERIGDVNEAVIEDTVLLANQVVKQYSLGFFAIDRVELGKKLNVIASVRYDAMNNKLVDLMNRPVRLSGKADYQRTTARVGLNYSFSPLFNIYANWGQGFLPPATEELANNPASYGGFNKDLVPATSLGEEIGFRGFKGDMFYYDLTFFYLNTDHDFYRYRIADRPLETFYGNAGSSKRFGVETSVKYSPVEQVLIQAAYTYSNFKYTSPDSISGDWLPNSPQHQLYAEVSYRFLKHFLVVISTELQSKWYIYTDVVHKDIYQNGFNLYHARVAYDFTLGHVQGEISLYGKNLTGKEYIAFTEPDPDGNSYQPGAGREFFGGIKLRF